MINSRVGYMPWISALLEQNEGFFISGQIFQPVQIFLHQSLLSIVQFVFRYQADCETKLPFLCKHSTAQPPTVGPNGECPINDFTDLDLSYQYCYRFESTNVLSWDDSQRACKAYGNGASLASIHSEDEMSKILGVLSTNQVTSWIGLFTTQNSGTNYFWVDDSAVDFINWESGEPNGNGPYGTELCVQAYAHNGKWNDASCTDMMGYVCKIPKSKYNSHI